MKQLSIVLGGAVLGGVAGFFIFGWLTGMLIYAPIVPGGLLGLGASFGKHRSVWPSIVCGIAGFALGVAAEWHYMPFRDPSFGFFIKHLSGFHWVLLALGGVLAFWLPYGHVSRSSERGPAQPTDAAT
jgi:hypothetical protein